MDDDTRDFGLDLGPNTFSLRGYYMDVRLQNISCKTLEVHIEHGNFFAQDLGFMASIARATFYSVSANLIVTTTRPTSMRYWQKSANKVCVTGARGSVYLRDACETSCALIDSAGGRAPKKVLAKDINPPPDKCPGLTRYACPRCTRNKISTIPGCVDLKTCTEQDNLECLCKPVCEMQSFERPVLLKSLRYSGII
jgi:hypothetical protein